MRAFKFLEHKYAADAVARGMFRVAPLSSYAALEDAQNDPLDGAVERYLSDVVIADGSAPESQETIDILRTMGVWIEGGRDVSVHNARHVVQLPGHALCFSLSPEVAPFGDKTAMIEIVDVHLLARLLAEANEELGPKVFVDRVKYGDVRFDARGHCPEPEPFQKAKRFEAEQEVRLFWNDPRVKDAIVTRPMRVPPGLLVLRS